MKRQINELKSINTAQASFDDAMKYQMNLVEERFKCLELNGLPVEVITYPGEDTLKVLID